MSTPLHLVSTYKTLPYMLMGEIECPPHHCTWCPSAYKTLPFEMLQDTVHAGGAGGVYRTCWGGQVELLKTTTLSVAHLLSPGSWACS